MVFAGPGGLKVGAFVARRTGRLTTDVVSSGPGQIRPAGTYMGGGGPTSDPEIAMPACNRPSRTVRPRPVALAPLEGRTLFSGGALSAVASVPALS